MFASAMLVGLFVSATPISTLDLFTADDSGGDWQRIPSVVTDPT